MSIPPLPLSTKKSTSANQSTDKNETQKSDLFSLCRVNLCWKTRNRYLGIHNKKPENAKMGVCGPLTSLSRCPYLISFGFIIPYQITVVFP